MLCVIKACDSGLRGLDVSLGNLQDNRSCQHQPGLHRGNNDIYIISASIIIVVIINIFYFYWCCDYYHHYYYLVCRHNYFTYCCGCY
jgi:hypothetical protein